MNKKPNQFNDVSKLTEEPLVSYKTEDLMKLPYIDEEPPIEPPKEKWLENYDFSLDGHTDFDIPKPKSEDEKKNLVNRFLNGLEKLFDYQNNWTFGKIFKLSMDYCVGCQTCSEACHTYIASGRQEIYRPTFRSEILRRIYKRYFTKGGKYLKSFVGADVELNYKTVWRLLELSYRCNICRRCAQYCPVGIDNALIAREIRKLFSEEMGIAPSELLKKGTRQHIKTGSSTGMTTPAFKSLIEYIEEDIHERTGRKIKVPVDKKGADILLIHNAGEFLAWPDNPAAFAILFDAAGINYTLSSETFGYDSVNYGLWFDDVEAARIGLRHLKIAKELGVKKIVVGECGHAHKSFCVILDRMLPGEFSIPDIPRESCIPLMWEVVQSGRIKFNPERNNFPFTLHDSCNIVRLMGIVQPQRNILKAVCAKPLREMSPNGVKNYCCGGGSGFAIMNTLNFAQFRKKVSERMKVKQVLEVFNDVLNPDINKMVVTTCSNCKGAMRDAIGHYGLWNKYRILYTGLAEVIVNAMADIPPFLKWEFEE
ncbi:MAG TPA: 4Fe-4S ferredoxin [Nitrospinae bacterium]|nr:4Fe-4S ferredoxin [Nitrospinota bacterium]HBA26689.1 4Fe-4S ferredoxin [Nitrospinota bacterium]